MTYTATLTNAEVFYLQPPADGSRAYSATTINPKTGERDSNWGKDPHSDIQIENIRGKEDTVSLDVAGFQFGRHAAKHTAFTDDEEIKKEYYTESAELVKQITGASRVVIFDHTLRQRRPGDSEDNPQKRQPAAAAHVDQTQAASKARVYRHVPEDADELVKHRYQIINLWRPIRHAAWDWPLALCDWRSVDVGRDLVPITLKFPDREGEIFGVRYSPEHKWKYLKGMEPDEFVLIKCFDSRDDGKTAIFTPHTAFDDTTKPEGAPLRESIELRMLVFYDD